MTSSTVPETNGTMLIPLDVINAARAFDTAPQISTPIPEAAISCALDGGNIWLSGAVPLRSNPLSPTS